jgi:hypothetical protein
MAKSRANFAAEVQTTVLFACKRRCAFCFGLEGDASSKDGQLAHIDRDKSNKSKSNAAWLCFKHHNDYDEKPSQGKRLTKGELLRYRNALFAHMKKAQPWTDTHLRTIERKRKGKTSLDVYSASLPIYKTTVEFLRTVAKNLCPEIQDCLKFARDTEEALFLFDETLAEYLTLLFRNALRLHTLDLERYSHRPSPNFAETRDEHMALSLWFTEQYDEIRSRFAPFLQLAD